MLGNEVTAPIHSGVRVEVRDAGKVFDGGVVAIEKIDLAVAPGEFVAILGPSGCGKSTLLRLIAGLDHPTSGTVDVERDGAIAYVFQDAHLLPWRNVVENVVLPLELMGVDGAQRRDAAREVIEQVGLTEAITRYPNQLSGGMRMRVSLARALVTQPRLLLLDEPFAALDEIVRQKLDEQLRQLWSSRGMTVLFVTHSIMEAAFLADRAVVVSRRPGRVMLDRKLELPRERRGELRGEAGFAKEMRTLYEAMERGMGEVG